MLISNLIHITKEDILYDVASIEKKEHALEKSTLSLIGKKKILKFHTWN